MRRHLSSAPWSLAAATVWFILAQRNPTLTYHAAPAIVAGAWPAVLAAPDRRALSLAGLGALGIALTTTVVLAADDALRGPDLVGGHAATAEAVICAVIGAGIAVGWRTLRQPTMA